METKRGLPPDKITDYLGGILTVDLKNHHKIVGTLSFYHLQEQMIHMTEWKEYDESGKLVREGRYMVINRTAWYQLYK